ncbi:tyrosine decarboxylase MfnA [Methanocaldococcus indicus]|uniref:tyrosine decarboxylase MfnA n=1 Tax=Methanocaldococcus indicus TaxID=213231 RepID=UPI003C6D6C32
MYEEIFKDLNRFRELDAKYEDGNIFCSMCSKPLPITKKIVNLFLETNLGDSGLFKGTAQLEKETIKLLGEFLNNREAFGNIVSGGTEANLTALRVIKKMKGRNIILPKTAHFSFEKGKEMMDLNLIYASLNRDYTVDTKYVKEYVEDNKVDAIIGIAGTTEFGTIDNIKELTKIAKDNNIYIHVDAAFGGFVIPFLDKKIEFDFSLNIDSITIDGHKMALTPIPCGGILFKSEEYSKFLETDAFYLIEKKQTTILGTRPGYGAACLYTILKYFFDEIEKNVKKCLKNSIYLYKKLKENGYKPLMKPTLNIVNIEDENYLETCEKLKEKNYFVSVCKNANALRLVIMPHIEKEHIDKFIEVLKEVKP